MSNEVALPAVEVAAPPVVPYPFGLFSLSLTQPPSDPHWGKVGGWWSSTACNAVGTTLAPCSVDAIEAGIEAGELLERVTNCSVRKAYAFTVFAAVDSSAVGRSLAELGQQARALLLAGEQFAVESYLWEQMLAETALPGAEVVTAATAVDVLAVAEASIADNYGGSPILHMSRASAMRSHEVVQRDGNRLASLLGSTVVAGGGYGASATEHRVIATGGLVMMRGEPYDFAQIVDRDINTVAHTVCRDYLIGWDCAAVQADLIID